MNRSPRVLLGVLLVVTLLLAACGQAAGTGTGSTTQAPQATAMVEQPTAMVEQPTAMVEQPTAMVEQPTAMAEQPTSGTAATGGDLLAAVKARGKLIISTDANYKP